MLKRPRLWLTGSGLAVFAWFLYMGIGWLPKTLRYWVLLSLAWILFQFLTKRREKIENNICLVRPCTVDVRKEAWTNVKTLVRSWSSLLSAQKDDLEKARRKIIGGELIKEAYDRKEKVVVVFPHVGDINNLTSVVAALGIEVFIPAEAFPPLLFKLIAGLRGRHGNIEFVPVRKGETKEVCAGKLEQGKVVVLAMDITVAAGKGFPFTIGGGLAYFRLGAVRIALDNQAKFFLAFPEIENGKQTVIIEPFDLLRDGKEDTEYTNIARVLSKYEPFLVRNCSYWWRLSFMDIDKVTTHKRQPFSSGLW